MRNSIFLAILLNICSVSIILAVYMCYKSIVATQEDIRKDIEAVNTLVRKEIVFDMVDESCGGIDVENCCDMTLTGGMPMYTEIKNV